jgi:lauroyl/myristoyl acyltransferase
MPYWDAAWRMYYLYRLGGALAPHLSASVVEALAAFLGNLFYRLDARGRENVRDNMRHVLGASADPNRIETAARAVHRHLVLNYLELFRLPALSPNALRSRVQVEGMDIALAALAEGRGLIGGSAHFGNPDTVAQVFALWGYPVLAPVEHVRPEPMFNYLRRLRETFGNAYIPVDGPLIALVRRLKAGGIVALALDRDPTGSGVVVDFFGAPAHLPDGAVQLALRTGAPFVVGLSYRLAHPRGHYRVKVERVELARTGDRQADVLAGVSQTARVLERLIAQAPEQWVLTTPIWRIAEGRP